jgi:hypothetical protein
LRQRQLGLVEQRSAALDGRVPVARHADAEPLLLDCEKGLAESTEA